MIHSVRIRSFKRFKEIEFRLSGHIVLAGPNDTGKTTVLQAIASWSLALQRWRELNDFNPRQGYKWAPLARQAFVTVPLRTFEFLWWRRRYRDPIEIELRHTAGWSVTMELRPDSTEQIYVRPKADADSETLRSFDLPVVFVPPMSGLALNEPLLQRPKIEQMLGLGRPGEIVRNLLAEANRDESAWESIRASMKKLFGYDLLPPDTSGPHILAEFAAGPDERPLDIASAGSGALQTLMLLAFLHTRPGAVLLLDEPDAHLHVLLEDAIHYELRTAAARTRSQLIAATHSEALINSVEPRELYVTFAEPRVLADTAERKRLVASLRVLSNADIMQAMHVRGIIYVEDYTDRNILRAWARQLGHRAEALLGSELMWKPAVFQIQEGQRGGSGIKARDHFEALQLVRPDLPGLELRDGDAAPSVPETAITGTGLQRLRWRRYEIESYLIHPAALARFVRSKVGSAGAEAHVEDLLAHVRENFPPRVVADPLGDHAFLNGTKARTSLLPPLLAAAGIHDLPYTRYHEIAALMRPDEIHPEVVAKLDGICQAFGVEP